MSPDQMEAAADRNADSIATATHNTVTIAYTQERMLSELRAECAGTARVVASVYGTYITAPYRQEAVELLRAIGGQWSKTDKAWIVQSSRHHLAMRICTFIYGDVEEYEEWSGLTTRIHDDTM